MGAHEIRLHAGWQSWRDSAQDGLPQAPDESAPPASGAVHLSRSFHWVAPRRSNERIFLELPSLPPGAELRLNGATLLMVAGAAGPGRAEVAGQLRSRNQLDFILPLAGRDQATAQTVAEALASNTRLIVESDP